MSDSCISSQKRCQLYLFLFQRQGRLCSCFVSVQLDTLHAQRFCLQHISTQSTQHPADRSCASIGDGQWTEHDMQPWLMHASHHRIASPTYHAQRHVQRTLSGRQQDRGLMMCGGGLAEVGHGYRQRYVSLFQSTAIAGIAAITCILPNVRLEHLCLCTAVSMYICSIHG